MKISVAKEKKKWRVYIKFSYKCMLENVRSFLGLDACCSFSFPTLPFRWCVSTRQWIPLFGTDFSSSLNFKCCFAKCVCVFVWMYTIQFDRPLSFILGISVFLLLLVPLLYDLPCLYRDWAYEHHLFDNPGQKW